VSALAHIIPADQFWPGEREIRLNGPSAERFAFIGSREGRPFLFTVPFDRSDSGRATSKRPRQSNDCTVRALAAATGAPYDTAYDALKAEGRKTGRGFNFRAWAKAREFGGYSFAWMSFPAVKGMWRVNPVTFALRFPEGRFILRVSKHVMACVDGRIVDTSRGKEGACVYGAWALIPTVGAAERNRLSAPVEGGGK
jgi:hypothetical protein